jgi:hypothetical protein
MDFCFDIAFSMLPHSRLLLRLLVSVNAAEDEAHPKLGKDSSVIDVWSDKQRKWLAPMNLPFPRKKPTAVSSAIDPPSSELVYFAGGFTSDSNRDNCGGTKRPGMGCYRNDVDIYNATSGVWSTAKLAQGRMRLTSTAVGECVIFAGGEVNTSHNDASGLVDTVCGGEWQVAELSFRRYELAAAALGTKAFFGGGNPGVGGNADAAGRVDVFDAETRKWTTASLPTPRSRLAAAAIAQKSLVCFGGGKRSAAVECLEA